MKKTSIFGSLIIFLLVSFAQITYANSPPPSYVNSAINWTAVIFAFAIGTLMEIILGYYLLRDKVGWLKALIVANIFSYPLFIGVLAAGGRFNSLLSEEQSISVIVVAGELVVIFLETLIIRKMLRNEISFGKSFSIISALNLTSWILGGQFVIFLFTEKFPYQFYDVIYLF